MIAALPLIWAIELVGVPAVEHALHVAVTADVVADGEEPEAQRAPDAADAVHGERTAGVVDPDPLGEVDGQDHDRPGDGTDGDRSGR